MDCLSNEYILKEGRLSIRGKLNHFDMTRIEMLETTFLENIVLDDRIVRSKFDKICQVVGLDLNSLVGKEMGKLMTNPSITFIEKVQICLARCLYQDFDIFVISNVFPRLSQQYKLDFFDRIIQQYLLFTTVIYHSNDPVIAHKSDLVLVFHNNNLVEQGKFSEITKNK